MYCLCLFTYIIVMCYTYCVFCFVLFVSILCLVCPMLPVSLDFLSAHSVFSKVYLINVFKKLLLVIIFIRYVDIS